VATGGIIQAAPRRGWRVGRRRAALPRAGPEVILSRVSVRSTITSEFQQVAIEQERLLAPLSDSLPLAQSGLDSLSFAILVARLEDSLGVNPFAAAPPAQLPSTFGEFVRLYENFRG